MEGLGVVVADGLGECKARTINPSQPKDAVITDYALAFVVHWHQGVAGVRATRATSD